MKKVKSGLQKQRILFNACQVPKKSYFPITIENGLFMHLNNFTWTGFNKLKHKDNK
jgi:hypothetical protein